MQFADFMRGYREQDAKSLAAAEAAIAAEIEAGHVPAEQDEAAWTQLLISARGW